jgi:ornithine--oxo-acid transaminase
VVSVFRALLCKETHVQTIRFAPPLVVGRDDLARALDTIAAVIGAPS